jgi:hypothetical protein
MLTLQKRLGQAHGAFNLGNFQTSRPAQLDSIIRIWGRSCFVERMNTRTASGDTWLELAEEFQRDHRPLATGNRITGPHVKVKSGRPAAFSGICLVMPVGQVRELSRAEVSLCSRKSGRTTNIVAVPKCHRAPVDGGRYRLIPLAASKCAVGSLATSSSLKPGIL